MEKEYYKEYYAFERSHWWFRARNEIILDIARRYNEKPAGERLMILNVGVATGSTSIMLREFGEVISVEYDKECCEFLAEHVGIDAINASITELPFKDKTFDFVCAFDVIEHVEDDMKAMMELKRVVKNEGLIMITVPAFNFLWSHHDDVNHHQRRYTLNELLSLSSKNELKILYKSYFNFFLFFPIAFYRIIIGKVIRSNKGAGSDFEINSGTDWLNSMLYKIFISEKWLLKNFPLPIGVSILLVAEKRA